MRLYEFTLPKNKWEIVLSNSDKSDLSSELVDLVQQAYSKTPQGSFVNSIRDVIPSDWSVIDWDQDPDVDACVFYRGPRQGEVWHGHKIQGIGHDGTRTSKDRAIHKVQEMLTQRGWWIESSDAMRSVLFKAGSNPVTDVRLLQKLFNDPKLEMEDKITYIRELPNGVRIKETVFGNPIV